MSFLTQASATKIVIYSYLCFVDNKSILNITAFNIILIVRWDPTEKHNRYTRSDISLLYSCCLPYTKPDDGLIN